MTDLRSTGSTLNANVLSLNLTDDKRVISGVPQTAFPVADSHTDSNNIISYKEPPRNKEDVKKRALQFANDLIIFFHDPQKDKTKITYEILKPVEDGFIGPYKRESGPSALQKKIIIDGFVTATATIFQNFSNKIGLPKPAYNPYSLSRPLNQTLVPLIKLIQKRPFVLNAVLDELAKNIFNTADRQSSDYHFNHYFNPKKPIDNGVIDLLEVPDDVKNQLKTKLQNLQK